MTIRQIWKNLTRNRRVKKSIRKIKADHMKGKSKDDLDAEFGKKYNIDLRKSSKYNYETYKIIPIL